VWLVNPCWLASAQSKRLKPAPRHDRTARKGGTRCLNSWANEQSKDFMSELEGCHDRISNNDGKTTFSPTTAENRTSQDAQKRQRAFFRPHCVPNPKIAEIHLLRPSNANLPPPPSSPPRPAQRPYPLAPPPLPLCLPQLHTKPRRTPLPLPTRPCSCQPCHPHRQSRPRPRRLSLRLRRPRPP